MLFTGSDSDGTAGLFSIKGWGGVTIVQDPEEAHSPVMPFTALRHLKIDQSVRLAELAALLGRRTAPPGDGVPDEAEGG